MKKNFIADEPVELVVPNTQLERYDLCDQLWEQYSKAPAADRRQIKAYYNAIANTANQYAGRLYLRLL